jgi:hypothetical protein
MLKDAAAAAGQSIEQAAAAFVKAQRPSSIIQRAATVKEVANLVVLTATIEQQGLGMNVNQASESLRARARPEEAG